ncbi:MAG: D-aminoacylase [Vicinamibacterales bacterium]
MRIGVRMLCLPLALFVASMSSSIGVSTQSTNTATRWLIRNARLIDGTGGPSRAGDLRVRDGVIAAIGALTAEAGETVVDAHGLTLAPGFIDTHSHHDRNLSTARDGVALLSQGVTTIVIGQDGGGTKVRELFDRLKREPVSVNVATFAGHGPLRDAVMGTDFRRKATPEEVAKMQALLKTELDAGALGFSTGLEYDPGIYSDPSEVLALAKTAADAGTRYVSHIRSEDRDFWKALDEVVTIGRTHHMPVQVSHIKLGMLDLWGQADKAVAVLDRARADGVNITADLYPYTYWQANLGVFFPKRNFSDRTEATFVLEHVTRPDGIIINSMRTHPDYSGKTLADIAALRKVAPVDALLALLAEPGGPEAGIIARGMDDRDVAALMKWPFTNICSDGQSTGLHPRGFGSFPKVLGRYVRDERVFSLEEGVRRMTSLAAANVGLQGRGTLAVGQAADLVLFDPSVVRDRADFGHAQDTAVGIESVWVNGGRVFDHGAPLQVFSGVGLPRTRR